MCLGLGMKNVYVGLHHWAVLALRILAPYRQKRKCYNVINIGCVCVFVDTGQNYAPPKLPIKETNNILLF